MPLLLTESNSNINLVLNDSSGLRSQSCSFVPATCLPVLQRTEATYQLAWIFSRRMSADRRSDRRAKRSAHSSPYARRINPSNPAPKKSVSKCDQIFLSGTLFDLAPKLWSISGLLGFLRFGGTENDDRAEDLVRSDTSSSSNDEDEGLHVQEQEPPPSIPVRRVQIDRNSAPEFVLPLPPGDVPPGHEVCPYLSFFGLIVFTDEE